MQMLLFTLPKLLVHAVLSCVCDVIVIAASLIARRARSDSRELPCYPRAQQSHPQIPRAFGVSRTKGTRPLGFGPYPLGTKLRARKKRELCPP